MELMIKLRSVKKVIIHKNNYRNNMIDDYSWNDFFSRKLSKFRIDRIFIKLCKFWNHKK